MRRHYVRKGIALCMVAAFVCGNIPISVFAVSKDSESRIEIDSMLYDTDSYNTYLAAHEGAARPEQEIAINGGDYAEASEDFTVLSDYEGFSGKSLLTQEEGSVTYEVEAPETGFYQMELTYYPIEGKNNSIERQLFINGEIPFEGARYLEFSRIWTNEDRVKRDSRDNDVRPKQTEVPEWTSAFLTDSDGYVTGAYEFYLEKGKNTITLVSVKEPMVIGSLTLKRQEKVPGYEEYDAANRAAGYQEVTDAEIKVQAEDAVWKSDSTLYPIADRTSPLTEPYNASKTRLNTIGGSNWKLVGQWITWQFEVPEDGLYRIMTKYRQNINAGVTVCRSMKLDGEIPFSEAEELYFFYENEWQMSVLGDGENPYYFPACQYSFYCKRLCFKVKYGIPGTADRNRKFTRYDAGLSVRT